jgi:hypothetical protein
MYSLIIFENNFPVKEYDIDIPPHLDPDELGMVYFCYLTNDRDVYKSGQGPLSRRNERETKIPSSCYSEYIELMASKVNVTLTSLFWLPWYIKRCVTTYDGGNFADTSSYQTIASKKKNQIVAFYKWSDPSKKGTSTNTISGGRFTGILVKPKKNEM